MKWLLVLLAVCFMVPPALAGEDPYTSVVVPDYLANQFYFSAKQLQFMYNEYAPPFDIPVNFGTFPPNNQYTRAYVGFPNGGEQFRAQTGGNSLERCDATNQGRGNPNAKTPAGNSGFYEWFIRLPKKPSGEINIVVQCGVLKPGGTSIELCAAETGERVGFGTCVRQEVDPGVSPVINTALPRITAMAYAGPFNTDFTPFHLTAFKNPSSYTLTFDAATQAMSNNGNSQVLDGSANTRILLKACMDKTIVTKLPVTGQINALGETETDLEAGDLVYVRMDIPRQNSVDVYCHHQSVRLAGVGETPY